MGFGRCPQTRMQPSPTIVSGTRYLRNGSFARSQDPLAIGLAIRARQAGHRVLFATAADWVTVLAQAHHVGKLQAEFTRSPSPVKSLTVNATDLLMKLVPD